MLTRTSLIVSSLFVAFGCVAACGGDDSGGGTGASGGADASGGLGGADASAGGSSGLGGAGGAGAIGGSGGSSAAGGVGGGAGQAGAAGQAGIAGQAGAAGSAQGGSAGAGASAGAGGSGGVTDAGPDATGSSNDCCAPAGTPGCKDVAIELCVCAKDGACCVSKWDAICVNDIAKFACGSCPDAGTGGAGGADGSAGAGGTGGAGGSAGAAGSGGIAGSGGVAGAGGSGGSATVLLIPDSTSDSVGKYDPQTGAYLGDFIPAKTGSEPWSFSTPINAVQGPNGNIYVSDQVADAVFEFDATGGYVGIFANSLDGLNNVRGIDFLGTDLCVTSAQTDSIMRFDASGTKLADYVVDSSLDPFDVFFLTDGRGMVADIGTSDQVRLYQAGGGTFTTVISVAFPEQIQKATADTYLVAAFSDDLFVEFKLDGTTVRSAPGNNPRGIYLLGNGNWLGTDGNGVKVIDPTTGSSVIGMSGTGYRFIEAAVLP